MDHYTRRIIEFGIHAGVVNGEALCRMLKQAIRGATTVPRYLSSDRCRLEAITCESLQLAKSGVNRLQPQLPAARVRPWRKNATIFSGSGFFCNGLVSLLTRIVRQCPHVKPGGM